MRLSVILFLSLILYISMANAKQKTNNVSIKQLIQKVKTSTGDDRRVAMNTLKVKLRSMNQETRQHVMRDLQKSFSSNPKGMQKNLQHNNGRGTMQQDNARGSHSSGGMQRSPSGAPIHSSPATIPHQPAPSIPKMPPAQIPAPHFGQPGGRK